MQNETNGPKRIDIIIDLETLGLQADAAIVSIGWVEIHDFQHIQEPQQVNVDLNSSLKYGSVDGGTLEWWFCKPQEVRKAAVGNPIFLKYAVEELYESIANAKVQNPQARVFVWGNGSTFDITILESASRKLELSLPWKYYEVRDLRTLLDIAQSSSSKQEYYQALDNVKNDMILTPHVAAHDAVKEACSFVAAMSILL